MMQYINKLDSNYYPYSNNKTGVIAFIYAIVLGFLPQEIFRDRIGYFDLAEKGMFWLEYYFNRGGLSGLTNEPLFWWIIGQLSQWIAPQEVIHLVVMVPAFFLAYYTLQYQKEYFWILLGMLLLPQVVKNHLVHIRQGMAVAMFMVGWYAPNQWVKWLLIGLSPFIHGSFFIIGGLWGLNEWTQKLKFNYRLALNAGYILLVALFLSEIARLFGARQAHYSTGVWQEVSGMGFLFWGGITTLFFIQGKDFIKQHLFSISILVLYLSTYFFVELSARIFESGMMVVLLTILSFKRYQIFTLLILLLYAIYFFAKNGTSYFLS
jgi:hypothetical protein